MKELDLDKVRQNLNKQKIQVSVRGTAIRVSPNVYNDAADLRKLVKALTSAL